MPRTLTIEQINELENGVPIPRFVGTIRKVLDQKTGDGQYGPWTLQTLFVGEPGLADDVAVTWTGEDPFDNGCEGATYSFECSEDKKGKLVGVMREIRTVTKTNEQGEKTTKTYKGVKVDNRSKIKRETTLAGKTSDRAPSDQQGESRNDEIRAKGDSFREPINTDPDWPEAQQALIPEAKPKNGDKIATYAHHAGKIFAAAWEESKNAMALIPQKDAQELTAAQWLDLRLRITQGYQIEINKIIRKERF